MLFKLLTPTKTLFDGEADSAVVPGKDGYVGFLEDHVPFITPLKPGVVEIESGSRITRFAVHGGYFEFSATGMVVLAENAFTAKDVDVATEQENLAQAEKELSNITENTDIDHWTNVRDKAEALLAVASH